MGNAGRQSFWKKTLILRVKGHIERLHWHLSGKLTVPIPLLEVRAVSLWQIVMDTGWSSSCSVCESPSVKVPSGCGLQSYGREKEWERGLGVRAISILILARLLELLGRRALFLQK